ncbi:origin recognition complex subunit 3 isoform X1 [Alligator mississippiensis]|uniref:Origin recognition complex subunit 3 n=1 Tax=Alligator mississippiensis TaxID=8496 RepID=A0A151MTZ2_ALLMI|nr:origin recognition complex subunit 3 isoform X1 [Alligator mississippiensis]KYO27949.1 origin recognition complex subunit 3 isoform A [Alligator mississippiensis]
MSTCSVSKGCFVFKPKSKKRRIASTADYFNDSKNDSEDSGLRFATCESLWKQIKSETEQIQEELNKQLYDNIIRFLRQSHSEFQEKKTEWACRMKSSEIPTAALVLGVNVTDHDLTFKRLSEVLQDNVTPYVVSLQAKECPGIRYLLKKLMGQLMDCYVEDQSEEEEYVTVSKKRIRCSLDALTDWYECVTKKTGSETPSKKRTSPSHWQSPPVVVIFKDMESFTTKVLQDFIVISSQHIHELPLVLIFGIATSPMIIHRLLPHSVSSLLCIELFQCLSCKEHLGTVIDKLLLTTKFPFKLSEKVLQVLINIFLYHDFSVQNFIKGFQLSVVEHFYSQPLSVLCCHLPEAKKRVNSFSHEQCEHIRSLPSFRRYVESQVSEKQIALLTEDNFVKEVTWILLEDLHIYHENYFPVLKCLHIFTSSLPKYPLGKQIRELHCACLEKRVWETEEYESALQLVRMLCKADLVAMLQKCVKIFMSFPGKEFGNTVEKLEEFLSRFQNLEVAEASKVQDESISSQKELQKKTDLYHLQKTLLQLKESRRSKKLTKFEMLRFEVVDFIDSLVRNYLAPAEMQTLHEVVYFGAASTLCEHLNAAPRTALHTALNNPYFYLKNQALKSDAGCISNKAPDICIAYKLHLECGRLINLVDWLEAFSTVVTAVKGTDSDSVASDEVDEIIHARFIRAVSELQLLGFIKPSKQKTDHVAKLTWGGC